MKFFLDANLAYSTRDIFSNHGEVAHARDVNLAASPDKVIANYAQKEGAVLVTQDLEFSNPHLFPAGSHRGLIIVRMPDGFTAAQTNEVLRWFLGVTPAEELESTVTVVEPGKIRRHAQP